MKVNREDIDACKDLVKRATSLFSGIADLGTHSKIAVINALKRQLHILSPMHEEPVDCVLWVPFDTVHGNDYNPNSVAPPEMKLLELSIESDGYTQPIVTMLDGSTREVIDGFHRHLVGQHSATIRERIMGYLPVVTINDSRMDKSDRIAATIRHNRARGKHKVEGMSEIVIELKRRNWSDTKIGRELGMDPDEVLRLTQITGLAEMFSDREFSKSWDIDSVEDGSDAELIDGESV